MSEDLKLAVPVTSPLALTNTVDLDDLRQESFVMLKNHILRDITMHFFNLCGYSPNIAFETDSPYTIRELVCAGLGITVWPEITWGKIQSDKAKLLSITNPICRRNIFVSWPDEGIKNQEVMAFFEFLKGYFRQRMRS